MADDKAVGAPALDTNIESGGFNNEKTVHGAPATHGVHSEKTAAPVEDEEEDEDIDALIEDLESQDGHEMVEEEEENTATGVKTVPEDMLQTDSRLGLTEAEVVARRRKYGLNQMKEEKENMILKFFSFFIGPIQYVMIVSSHQFLLLFLSRTRLCAPVAVTGFAQRQLGGVGGCRSHISFVLFISLGRLACSGRVGHRTANSGVLLAGPCFF
jgi:hypothetical protein